MIACLLLLKRSYLWLIRDFYPSYLIYWLLMLAFLVKLPLYGLHQWLPKAHVESPTIGRCILARIMLKTGRYGVWVILKWLSYIFSPLWPLLGAAIVRVISRVQVDRKRLVALRRVAHLNLVIAALITGRAYGYSSFLLISITHGLASRCIFYIVGSARKTSRLLYYLTTSVLVCWLLLLVLNLGIPPAPSFWREIFSYFSLMYFYNNIRIILIISGIFLGWITILIWLSLKNNKFSSTRTITTIISWKYLILILLIFNLSLCF